MKVVKNLDFCHLAKSGSHNEGFNATALSSLESHIFQLRSSAIGNIDHL